MISKTIGFRGTLFSDTPIFQGKKICPDFHGFSPQFPQNIIFIFFGNLDAMTRISHGFLAWQLGLRTWLKGVTGPITGEAVFSKGHKDQQSLNDP